MKKLILASNNKKKISEMKEILKEMPIEVKSLADEDIDIEVVEDGETFEENAKKKSREIYEFLLKRGDENFIVLSDDSGLSVDYLDGAPGVYSARYAGQHGDDARNNKKLLVELSGIPKEKRGAKFTCQLAMFTDQGKYYAVKGEVKGYIIEELHGEGGFGYDPLFFYEPLNKTFGELTAQEKNEVSHRGVALKELKKIISNLI
ncbi:XTP/dITP diphosphatase [Clostridium saccharobutylicum]|uniref:dITP/XTP pyrophosphatase n=2 Tax=Clostridium saccharobutylicum TaxID=169679 RepID=U5MLI5_CLOSA|nr:XTP/dITP diphosphatase [Clostridium saccharobutylicum]AGX41440.1 Non-canonical purine NTP pyrophosphatase [Clostridium saccharobutylicum DSM 13864]AQR88721.1 Non-canonical purine NTP pyrophosphatase [Clostridium saccharobutylicum]AQR98619.1 Non-canonical purine NTP pyrophosphatase [Clostridium saccharobutylicum]AQS12609.1 Non-canonical purine NTP pyrophosphatase [Clostridium saccharobutylicum]MBA2905627.1 XTP/dITP diphosphohydrolase [Clostridium saccharobutylicum]